MKITINTRNVEMTDHLQEHIEKKVGKLDRYLSTIDEARVDLSVQSTRSAGDREVVQLTLRGNGTLLRAEERSSDLQTSLDAALDKIVRQIKRYKGKHWRSKMRAQNRDMVLPEETEPEIDLVRVKRFQTRPMDVEDAIEQMELLGHDFFAFYNADTGAFNVIYRRHGGGYGLLQPELA